jgi:ActR/RegA family two-component response regulator
MAALANWERFSHSSRRGILEWTQNARRPETRFKRIQQTIDLAGQNIKATTRSLPAHHVLARAVFKWLPLPGINFFAR